MPYYGGGSGTGGGGTNDHRLLAGRSDVNQHPATAVSVTAIGPLGSNPVTVQAALEALAETGGWTETNPTAAIAIGAYKAVAFRSDGQIEPADHDNPAHPSRLAGITLASVTAGAEARVCAMGAVKFGGWSWIPGAPVFIGTNGDMAQAPPETGFVQHIGFALGRDALLVQIERSIRRK